MKKTLFLVVLSLIVNAVSAQFDKNYSFWNEALNPNNNDAELIKKLGFTTIEAISYNPQVSDTAETITEIKYSKFDSKGRVIYSAQRKTGKIAPSYKYVYDKKGRVKKFTYLKKYSRYKKQYPEEVYEFEYSISGIKSIKYTGYRANKWDANKRTLELISATDTIVYGFNKMGKLISTKHKTKKTKTTTYTYNNLGKIIGYELVEGIADNDTLWYTKAWYTYNKNNVLVMEKVVQYKYTDGIRIIKKEEEFTFIISDKNNKIKALESKSSHFYWQDEEEMNDFYTAITSYFYNNDGLLIKAEAFSDPNFESIAVFKYSK